MRLSGRIFYAPGTYQVRGKEGNYETEENFIERARGGYVPYIRGLLRQRL